MFKLYRLRRDQLKKMDKKNDRICLSDLYKNEDVRNLIRDILGEEFDDSFERLMREGKKVKSLLINKAMKYKDDIKEQYIEFGMELTTLENLRNILEFLKLLDDNDCQSLNFKYSSTDSVPNVLHNCND